MNPLDALEHRDLEAFAGNVRVASIAMLLAAHLDLKEPRTPAYMVDADTWRDLRRALPDGPALPSLPAVAIVVGIPDPRGLRWLVVADMSGIKTGDPIPGVAWAVAAPVVGAGRVFVPPGEAFSRRPSHQASDVRTIAVMLDGLAAGTLQAVKVADRRRNVFRVVSV